MAAAKDSHESGGLGLLDFFFTFAIATGLTPEILEGDFKGVLSEPWLRQGGAPTSPRDAFSFIALVLALLTTVMSWFGYHRSIQVRPVSYDSFFGMIRFTLDVLLIALYGLMLFYFKLAASWALVLMLVFWIYALWDILRFFEYRSAYGSERTVVGIPVYELIPIPWAAVATVGWLCAITSEREEPWLTLALGAIVIVGFRASKHLARRGTAL